MSRWRRIGLTVAAMLAVLLLAAAFRYGQSRGVFTSVADKTPAACHAVAGIGGVTAIAAGPNGNLYLAAADGLYLYSGGKAVRFTGTPKGFHPTALSQAASGELQVLFRQNGVWEISAFTVKLSDTPKLEELGRISTDSFTDPADIQALPAGRFYLVNRHKTHTALGRWLDDVFLIPRAEVQFFDGLKFVTVSKRLNAPSAVAASDGMLYVAQELPRTLAIYQRNEFSGALGDVQLFNLPAAPAKISRAKDGSLIVAAWPKSGQGAVYRVTVAGGIPQSAELLYASKSQEVTAAAEAGGALLIGTNKVLLACAQP